MHYSLLITALLLFSNPSEFYSKGETVDIHTAVKDKLVKVEVTS